MLRRVFRKVPTIRDAWLSAEKHQTEQTLRNQGRVINITSSSSLLLAARKFAVFFFPATITGVSGGISAGTTQRHIMQTTNSEKGMMT